MSQKFPYTTRLSTGLGLIDETMALLDLWEPELINDEFYRKALESGRFPNISARRLKNIIRECFAPRYLCNDGIPALTLKKLANQIPLRALLQFMFLFTARANSILYDFVCQIYWPAYASGRDTLSNHEALSFVESAITAGQTTGQWSEKVTKNVAGYLTGCCSDFGLLEKGHKQVRRFNQFTLNYKTAAFLSYDLHFSGIGDNAVIAHHDWELFGLEKEDVRDVLKRLSLKGFFIIQTAGAATHIGWKYKTWEDLIHVIAES